MSMKILFGAVADDFTGASDLAALMARSGAPVTLRMGLEGLEDAEPAAPFEIIALKSRTIDADEAVCQSLAAMDWLARHGAERFYFKYCSTFDSRPSGNIGPVAEAMLLRSGGDRTIFAPSFPANRRTVYCGNLFVNGVPLHESPMRDHPLTPMRDSDLVRVLQAQSKAVAGLVPHEAVARGGDAIEEAIEKAARSGQSLLIADAIDDDDLARLADVTADWPLLTGGSAFAGHLPALWRAHGLIDFEPGRPVLPPAKGRALILSGSCSAMTQAQVAHMRDRVPSLRIDPLALASGTQSLTTITQWLSTTPDTQPVMVYASADAATVRHVQDQLGVDEAGRIVEDVLAATAAHCLKAGFGRFVVAGGETSGAVVQRLGINRVTVGPEIAPGVPWNAAEIDGRTVHVTLKSGNFGSERFFEEALNEGAA